MTRVDRSLDSAPLGTPWAKQFRVSFHPELESTWRALGGADWLKKTLVKTHVAWLPARERWVMTYLLHRGMAFSDALWYLQQAPDTVVLVNGRTYSEALAREEGLEIAPMPAESSLPPDEYVRMDSRDMGGRRPTASEAQEEREVQARFAASRLVAPLASAGALAIHPSKPSAAPPARAPAPHQAEAEDMTEQELEHAWRSLPGPDLVLPATDGLWTMSPLERMRDDVRMGQRSVLEGGRQPEDPED